MKVELTPKEIALIESCIYQTEDWNAPMDDEWKDTAKSLLEKLGCKIGNVLE